MFILIKKGKSVQTKQQKLKMVLSKLIIKLLHLSDGNYAHYKTQLTIYYYLKRLSRLFSNSEIKKNVSFIPQNHGYGHEYWLKKYSGWNKPIYGEIEHGIYFGRNCEKSPIFSISYELKVLITYGKYREDALKKTFQDYDIYMIGPRIAYANTGISYEEELLKRTNGEKVCTIFPSHSIFEDSVSYDAKDLIKKSQEIANRNGINKLRVCLRKEDIAIGNAKEFERQNIDIVSANSINFSSFYDAVHFLPRLRAIMETSSLMISNSLGTHLGYGLYLGVPQIMLTQKLLRLGIDGEKDEEVLKKYFSADKLNILNDEADLFADIFAPSNGLTITDRQREICNYYWGFDQVKSPDELYKIFETIYKKFKCKN